MSIPKVIHYCWFGGGELPKMAEKCIRSWQKYCPDYQIICWNENNFDVNENRYAKEAYEAKKWAFVSDYVRLKVLYEQGGIYLDTDVELLKPLDSLIEHQGYVGYEQSGLVSTGLGFACEAGNSLIEALLRDYDEIPFQKADGSYDLMPCPDRNTETLKRLGLVADGTYRVFMNLQFLPAEYLCPMDYYTSKKKLTKNTYSVHLYCASWTSKTSKRTLLFKRLLGVKLYDKLYGKFLHKFKWLEW